MSNRTGEGGRVLAFCCLRFDHQAAILFRLQDQSAADKNWRMEEEPSIRKRRMRMVMRSRPSFASVCCSAFKCRGREVERCSHSLELIIQIHKLS